MEFFKNIDRFLDQYLTPGIKMIVKINVVVFLLMILISIFAPPFWGLLLVFLSQNPYLSVFHGWLWQFVTYMFVHVEFFHLIFNMLGLGFFGPILENRWGTRRFLKFYLTVGIGAGIFHAVIALIFKSPESNAMIIGASGAIYGVLLAFAAYNPDAPVIFFIFPIKAKHMVMIFFAMNFFPMALSHRGQVSNLTHLTGFLVAYLWLAWYHRDWDIRRWRWTREW